MVTYGHIHVLPVQCTCNCQVGSEADVSHRAFLTIVPTLSLLELTCWDAESELNPSGIKGPATLLSARVSFPWHSHGHLQVYMYMYVGKYTCTQ